MRPSLLLLLALGCAAPVSDRFEYVLEEQPGAFFSVHGTGERDVWVAGAADGGGLGLPALLHYDGAGWRRADLSGLGLEGTDLWWVHARAADDVFAAGENGTILRGDGTTFARMASPDTRTVFGLWAAGPDEAWAVGGAFGGGEGFVWHLTGGAWTEVPLPADHPGAAVFKVWGIAPDEVWFCGLMGTLMRWDGSALSMLPSPTTRSLFTVHAAGGELAVVGGAGSAVILRGTPEGGFEDVTPSFDGVPPAQANGVWLSGAGEGWAVGIYGSILRLRAGRWEETEGVYDDLHGVWVDPAGGVWAVGGRILAPPFTGGVVVHRGAAVSGRIGG